MKGEVCNDQISYVCRSPELSRDEFQDYWLNNHGPLLQKFATTYKVYRYVQSHTMRVSWILCKRNSLMLRHRFIELDSKAIQRRFPVPYRHRPFFADV